MPLPYFSVQSITTNTDSSASNNNSAATNNSADGAAVEGGEGTNSNSASNSVSNSDSPKKVLYFTEDIKNQLSKDSEEFSEELEEDEVCSDLDENFWGYEIITELLNENFYPIKLENSEVQCLPNESITRSVFVAWLIVKYYPEEVQNFDNSLLDDIPFSDISKDDPYAPYIMIAYEENIINGYDDGTFKKDDFINRAELIKILLESLNLFENTPQELDSLKNAYPDSDPFNLFADISRGDEWFYPYLYFSTAHEMIVGRVYGNIKKADMSLPVSYSEAAKLLYLMKK